MRRNERPCPAAHEQVLGGEFVDRFTHRARLTLYLAANSTSLGMISPGFHSPLSRLLHDQPFDLAGTAGWKVGDGGDGRGCICSRGRLAAGIRACWPGSELMRAFHHKALARVQRFPAIDVSYIRHKIMLTLPLADSYSLSSKGLRAFLTAHALEPVCDSAATHWQPLCTLLLSARRPGFRFAAVRWSDACRNALFAGARNEQRQSRRLQHQLQLEETAASRLDMCRRKKGAAPAQESSEVPVSAGESCRGRFGPRLTRPAASPPANSDSAVFNIAFRNAHIEWRFPQRLTHRPGDFRPG